MNDKLSEPSTRPLPEFDSPPVIEVALAVQFEKLDTLRVPQMGYLWQTYRSQFPRTEEQPPIEPVFEQFGLRPGARPNVRLQLVSIPPLPRVWFLNDSGTELLQVQQDRFIRNWRKQENADGYPRYKRLQAMFRKDFEAFCRLVDVQKWGTVEPNQCEVTYVNMIPAGEGWQDHGDLAQVLTVFQAHYTDDYLEKPEEVTVDLQYVLKDECGEPAGRLHVAASPVLLVTDNQPAIRLTLTARGRPRGGGIDGVMRFLDQGHEAIVRGFASMTTEAMHKIWKRKS
ncbi:MAG: TIGR04255 family protein [Pirellulales bacterium]